MSSKPRRAPRARSRTTLVAVVLFFLGVVGAGCSDVDTVARVDLDSPDEARWVQPGPSQARTNVVRIAFAGVTSPEATARSYEDLVAYLEGRLSRPVEVVQKRTYAEINALLKDGAVQAAFVCSLAYVLGRDDFGVELLVAPEVDEGTVYSSYLIVPAGSRDRSLADLRGGVFAFSDPLSNSGHLVPVYRLSLLGEEPDRFFERTLFTDSHDNSVRSVADGLVDGAAVDSLVYDGMLADHPELARRTRVIERWGPYGIPPLVVPASVDPDLRRSLEGIFLTMADDEAGATILEQLGVNRFVTVDDSLYDGIREMWQAIGGRG